jgi:hypothetical protein
MVEWLTLQPLIPEVLGSSLGPETVILYFCSFPQYLQANAEIVHWMRSQLLPSTSFPINHSSVIVSLDTEWVCPPHNIIVFMFLEKCLTFPKLNNIAWECWTVARSDIFWVKFLTSQNKFPLACNLFLQIFNLLISLHFDWVTDNILKYILKYYTICDIFRVLSSYQDFLHFRVSLPLT